MNISNFLKELDELYDGKKMQEVEPFFEKGMKQAIADGDTSAQFTILNEMMGFFRDTSQYDKSIKACHQCLDLMKSMGIEGTVDYATSLQNIANAHRAAGLLNESMEFYREAKEIYDRNIAPYDYRYASMYNNIALLYQEMGDFGTAVDYLKKALPIITKIKGREIEVATTQTNLGASLLELGRIGEATEYLTEALEVFRKDEIKNFHYSAALSAMAAAKSRLGDYVQAVSLYEEALREIEINMGKGSAYEITKENLENVRSLLEGTTGKKQKQPLSGLELAKKFYEQYGIPMIHENFPEYESKIAVGFVGEGSERFGFDDKYSTDHDFGPGFCMWVSDDTYEKIGERLQEEYGRLPKSYLGIMRKETAMAAGRVGVQRIGDFYEKYTGYRTAPKSVEQWIELDDGKLATVTNGEVFKDDEGIFSEIRNAFLNQPESARLVKLARTVSAMAQTGQCNYGRSMARKDYVTAKICICEFMQQTMRCLFILNRKYAPYYKWLLQGTKTLPILPEVGDIMRALADMTDQREAWENYVYSNTKVNENDQNAMIIEIVAKLIIHELENQKIIENANSSFLNDYVGPIMEKAGELMEQTKENREQMIDKIVKLEFEAFDKVQNEGGRAECQNNWPFFYIMRKSQYMTWTDEMLAEILNLWMENKQKGWNMITEKYGRMMESTAPEEYEKIKKHFPKKDERTLEIINQIVEIQVGWMMEFSKQYPKLAANARDITSDADEKDNTSYETYLRGELMTYSNTLVKLYANFVVNLAQKGQNLAQMTIENTAKLQGYNSLEEAEKSLL